MTKKLLIILLIVVVAGGAVIGGIFAWRYWQLSKQEEEEEEPEVEVPADWKTYRNEEYGFEIKYPKGWEVLNNNPYGEVLDFSFRDKKYDGSFEWSGLRITDKDVASEFSDIKIPSRIFKKEEAENEVIRIYFDESGRRLYATCALYLEPIVIESCNQMLSTFRFVEVDGTADWKTYRNEEYGFEIKYPGSWYEKYYYPGDLVELQNIDGELYISTGGPCEKCVKDEGVRISIMVGDNLQKLPIDDFLYWCKDKETFDCKSITVGGVNAVELVRLVDFGAGWPDIYVPKGDKIFVISYAETSAAGNYLAIFNQMLSTFKFIESSEIDTADWKTYRNEELGIGFKYPLAWKPVEFEGYIDFFGNFNSVVFLKKDSLPDLIKENIENFCRGNETGIFPFINPDTLLSCIRIEIKTGEEGITRDGLQCWSSVTGGDMGCEYQRTFIINTKNEEYPILGVLMKQWGYDCFMEKCSYGYSLKNIKTCMQEEYEYCKEKSQIELEDFNKFVREIQIW